MEWTSTETSFLNKNYERMTIDEIAERIDKSYNQTKYKATLLGLKKGHIQYHLTNESKKLTPDLAYIIGTCLGDGSIRCEGRGYTRTVLSVIDKDFALCFYDCLKRQFNITPSFHKIYLHSENRNDMWRVKTSYKEICYFLRDFNMNKMLRSNKKIKSAFLRGMYDSEGSVGLNKGVIDKIEFTNTNKKIIAVVISLLKDFSINTTIYKAKRLPYRKDCYRLYMCGKENFIKFKKYIGFSIKRKHKRLNLLPREHTDKKWRKRLSIDAKNRPRDNFGRYIKRKVPI
jgi:intein-encoded DNA endonuclease-like protein